jgi:putative DNA primase/helicase
MTMTMQRRTELLGGEVCNKKVRCPGPGHPKMDRSLVVSFKKTAPEGFLVHSFCGDSFEVCRDYVRELLGLAFFGDPKAKTQQPVTDEDARDNEPDNSERALELWSQSKPIAGTLGEKYLAESRDFRLTIDLDWSSFLRFQAPGLARALA